MDLVSFQLGPQANAATLLTSVDQQSPSFCRDGPHGHLQLITAVAAQRPGPLACEALRMDTHQRNALRYIPENERKRGFSQPPAVRDFALEPDGLKDPPFGRHSGGGNSSRSGLRCWFHVRPLSECRLGNRRRAFHSGEIRRALLKERRERLLGFRGAHGRGEFLVLQLYRLLTLFA